MPQFIDITAPLSEQMPVWPGAAPVAITQTSDMAQGDLANTKHMSMPNHIGTHMDAPLHFIKDGASLDLLPLEAVCGPATLVYIDTDGAITEEQLRAIDLNGVKRLLIRTRNSTAAWWKQPFLEHFAHFSTAAAQYLATTDLALVGVDYLSVAGYNKNEEAVHKAILGKGIWIIEGLQLADVNPGDYTLYCLPLKLQNADGAPCRAILVKE